MPSREHDDPSDRRRQGGLPDCSLLVPYALSVCSDADAEAFEVHVLSCDRCFENLKAIDRSRELVREFMISSPVALTSARAVLKRRSRRRLWLGGLGALAAFALGFALAQVF